VPQSRKKRSFERTDKAISQMVKEVRKSTFTVAGEGVSVAYLYKHDLNSALTS